MQNSESHTQQLQSGHWETEATDVSTLTVFLIFYVWCACKLCESSERGSIPALSLKFTHSMASQCVPALRLNWEELDDVQKTQQSRCVSSLIQSIFCTGQTDCQCTGSVSESVIQKTSQSKVCVCCLQKQEQGSWFIQPIHSSTWLATIVLFIFWVSK